MTKTGTDEVDLRYYLGTISRRRTTIVLVALGLVSTSIAASLLATPVYRASAEVLVQPRGSESVFNPDSSPNSPAGTVETEIRVVRSDPVRNAVTARLGHAPKVEAIRVGETEVMRISAVNRKAGRAAEVANAYAESYVAFRKSQAVGDLETASDQIRAKIEALDTEIDALDRRMTGASASDRDALRASLGPRYTNLLTERSLLAQKLDSLEVDAALKTGGAQLVAAADVPRSPASPKPVRNALVALLVGLILGVGLVFLREHLNESIDSKDELVRAVPDVPVLGTIPVLKNVDLERTEHGGGRLRLADSPATEAYRSLRTSIQLLGVERPRRTLQVTSPGPGEGKTTVLANLAIVLAAGGQRVVVVDCDLRRPRIHEVFGVSNEAGFTTAFLGDRSPLDLVQPVPGAPSLAVMTSGPIPPNPSELLSSNRTSKLLFELQDEFEVVLVDSPPVLPVTDAIALAAWVESTILVVRAGTTTRTAVAEAVERLRRVDAEIGGTVLNRSADDGSYGYYYGYASPKSKSTLSRRRQSALPKEG